MYNESCNDEIYLTTLSEGEGALYVLFGAIESIVSPNHTGVDQDVLLLIEAYLIFIFFKSTRYLLKQCILELDYQY